MKPLQNITSAVNTASMLDLRDSQRKSETENTASLELIKKGQEELSLMMATFIKQNSFPPTNKEINNVESFTCHQVKS